MEGLKAMSKLNILYEDNHVIVVVKEVNIPTQEDASKDKDLLSMVKDYIKEKYQKPGNVYLGLVHRLDRPVSGILVFARTSKAASRLSEEVRTHKIEKRYLAVVHGILEQKEGTLIDYLKKGEDGTTIVSEDGKEAKLDYKVLEEDKRENLSLVEINLHTGRHHQIRVQFAHIGHPLYGDQRYGYQDKKQIALHAYYLRFVHPTKKESMTFQNLPTREPFSNFPSIRK